MLKLKLFSLLLVSFGSAVAQTNSLGQTFSKEIYGHLVSEDICVQSGDSISITSSGSVRLGFFAGSAGPQGLPMPSGLEIYNIDGRYPHGALLCRVQGESSWQYCGDSIEFTASTNGCLEFAVNDVDQGNNAGRFQVEVEVNSAAYSASSQVEVSQFAPATDVVGDVSELLSQISQGGIVEIPAGTYELDTPLILQEDIHLVGAGKDETFIISVAEEYVVKFEGNGNFSAKSITFGNTGDLPTDVMHVASGTIDIDNCRFTGAVIDEEDILYGAGLFTAGNTKGTVKNSVFENNGLSGIDVNNEAEPNLEDNILRNNLIGIGYFDNSQGVAVGNMVEANSVFGIQVNGKAQPILKNNTLSGNEGAGILYFEDSGGVAAGNIIEANGIVGIQVGDEAQPTLENNTLSGHEEDGIVYSESSGGVARGNVIEGNNLDGIYLQDNASPRLENNTLSGNKENGINYIGDSGGVAVGNIVKNNLNGIVVQNNASPRLIRNTARGNEAVGIAYIDSANGVVIGNTSKENSYGVVVGGEAQPTLENNTFINNITGIVYGQNSGGAAIDNTSERNSANGIQVQDEASPKLENNVLRHNEEYGIVLEKTVAPTLINNVTTDNKKGNTLSTETINPPASQAETVSPSANQALGLAWGGFLFETLLDSMLIGDGFYGNDGSCGPLNLKEFMLSPSDAADMSISPRCSGGDWVLP